MRPIFFITSLFLATLCSCRPAESVKISATDPDVMYMGRTFVTPDGYIAFNYPGVTAMLNFDGNRLDMETNPGSGYFMVEIDGGNPRKIYFSPSDSIMTLADSLSRGPHSARITYAVEGYEFNPEIRGFILDSGGKILDGPQRPSLKLEFIGNSITCGYGTEATDGEQHFSYDTENHTLGYAWRTARALDADFNIVARSGIGLYRNYNGPREGSPDQTMPMEYDRTRIYDDSHKWDFRKFQPDIVCLNLGTNDTSCDNYDKGLFEAACSGFIDHLREVYPKAKIVLLTGSMMNGKELEDVKDVLDRQAASREGVYRFDMSPQTGDLGYGADYHPSAQQSEKMAAELTGYLRTIIRQ